MSSPRIVRTVPRPSGDQLAAIAGYGVATLHEANHRRGLVDSGLRPLAAGQFVSGPALTVLVPAGDNLMIHAAIEVARAGDVLVLGTTSPSTQGMVGELLVTQARAHGIVGMVLDSGVRDTAAIRAMGFPIWSRAISAAGTTKATPGWVNVSLVCGGVVVQPGDVVVADDDGVVVVPAGDIPTTLDEAERRDGRERDLRVRYAAGEMSLDIHGLREVIAELGVIDEDPSGAGAADDGD